MAVMQACKARGKDFAIARYHNVYGPRMGKDHVVPEVLARIRSGARPFEVFSPGERRAFCYVSDAIEATLRLITHADPAAIGGKFFDVTRERRADAPAYDESARLRLRQLSEQLTAAPAV